MGLPKGWNAEAHAEWESGKRAEAIGATLTALHHAKPATAELALQAGYYLFIVGDLPLARQILEGVRQTYPDHLDLLLNLARAQKVDLAQISILQLVDQYTDYIASVLAKFTDADRAEMADDDGMIQVGCAFCARSFPVPATAVA